MTLSHWSLRAASGLILALIICEALPAQGQATGWSLFPPFCAILIGILSGRLILGLTTAILGTALLVSTETTIVPLVADALRKALLHYLWGEVAGEFSLHILGFTIALIGMVRVTSLAGGNAGIADLLSRGAEGARSARKATALLGTAIFFDDYANTIVAGSTMRPITDRFRVSREKLAYLVDSTAAPIAGLAIISTWIGYEVGLFEGLMIDLGTGISGYALFFSALPARFYCLLALVFVFVSTWAGRDFGPMLAAERRAYETGEVLREGARPLTGRQPSVTPAPGLLPTWWVAAFPVVSVVVSVVAGIALDAADSDAAIIERARNGLLSSRYWAAAFSEANTGRALFNGALIGSGMALLLAWTRRDGQGRRPISLGSGLGTYLRGVVGIHYAIAILILAWAIKEACQDIGTADYLTALLSPLISPAILPVLIFLLAATVAFSIGTSWATMAILVPTVVPLAHNLGGMPLTILAAAAVLDGAIFGDHCSPISDTTVMSSIASSCDHLDHVRTQIPYALVTMGCAALFGYLGAATLYPAWVGILIGGTVITALIFTIGKKPDNLAEDPTGSRRKQVTI